MAKTKPPQRFVHTTLLSVEERGVWRSFVESNLGINRTLQAKLRLQYGLTLSEYDVLCELTRAHNNQLRMQDLADHLLFRRSQVTRIIDRLEDAGCVARDDCRSDGRGVLASLTKAGYETLETAEVDYVAAVRQYFLEPLRGYLQTMRKLLVRLESEDLSYATAFLARVPAARRRR